MKTLIIAEAGVNHNGDLEKARELVRVAARAGADMVKFQTFVASELATAHAPKADYQKATTDTSESQRDMIARLELSHVDHIVLIEECRRAGIAFFSTAFDGHSLDMLVELGIDRIKVPSGELTNLPLLRHIASKRLPVILSTGMATMGEIEDAISELEAGGIARAEISVLHCNTEYPTPMRDVNLRAMTRVGEAFGVAVGYSDHTMGIEIPIAAVALGATLIEKHFTLDRTLPGPDHMASLEPDELVAMVAAIRNIEQAMAGDGIKRPSPSEARNRPIARRSIVAARAIAAGETFSDANLAARRPGTGISPMRWDEVVGRSARRAFAPDDLIEL
ncbi:N-acetylneuraminate synthase [Sphingomonas sp. MMS24-J13]|uniref:N-acetylneuraminate synthase n=1 Tax=Sphingomonas sp. MMS24-J13 TaxID=3238686 RepID=UPI00384E7EA2